MKKLIWVFIFVILLVLILFAVNSSKVSLISQNTPIPLITLTPSTVFAKVTKVIDGDTIEIEGGQKVRYVGMDTNEIYPDEECFALEAKKANEELVLGKTIRMEKDTSDTDKYGRLLRYVYIDDEFINEKLVRSGYARVATYPPDVKYQMNFSESEKYARGNRLGLWASCESI